MKYAFIRAHREEFGIRAMCRVLRVHFSGFYPTRNDARRDVFEYIERCFNPKRKHTNNGMQSHVDFETRQQKLNEGGI